MQKDVASIMNHSVFAVDIDDTVESVQQLIHKGGYSFVPVLDGHRKPFGVISATDLVQFHVRHEKAQLKRAWEICTHQVLAVPPDMKVFDAAQLMVEKHVHHLLVMEAGRVSGIVSTLDLIDKFLIHGPQLLALIGEAPLNDLGKHR